MNRLFVSLKSKPFQWFKSGDKKWEIRGINSNFNEKTVREGREVELRKGYNGESLWGKITRVEAFHRISEIPKKIEIKKIIPSTSDEKEFEDEIESLLSSYDEFIAFEVVLNR